MERSASGRWTLVREHVRTGERSVWSVSDIRRRTRKIFNMEGCNNLSESLVKCVKMAYSHMSGCRVRGLRGGNLNNGLNDGAWYVNVNNALSNSNANNGCRLSTYLRQFYSGSICHHLLVNRFALMMLVVWRELIGRAYAEV